MAMGSWSKIILAMVLALFLVGCSADKFSAEKSKGSDEAKMKELDQRALMVQTDR